MVLGLLGAAVFLFGPAAFGADLGFRGFGAQAGLVSPSDWDTGYELGLHLDLGEIMTGLFLQPSVMYWKASATDSFPGFEFDRDLSNLALGADVLWYPSGERRAWYVGGGAYLNRLEFDVFGRNVVSDNRFGPNALGGYDFAIGGTSAFAEARYHVVSGFNTFQLGLGLRFAR